MGATNEIAARYGGVSETSFYEWIRRGGQDADSGLETEFSQFAAAVKDARADSDMTDLAAIKDAINNGTWQAAAWRLERRYPKDFGRSVREEKPSVTTLRFEIAGGEDKSDTDDGAPDAGAPGEDPV